MAFFILLIGVFITIAIKKKGVPIFKTQALDMVHLTLFNLAIALSVINSAFVQLVPNIVMIYISIILVVPLFAKLIKRNDTADA